MSLHDSQEANPNSPSDNDASIAAPDSLKVNGLAECLIYIAERHELSANMRRVLRGLPVKTNELPLAYLERGASNAGLRSRLVKRKIQRLPSLVLPCIIALTDGTFAVLESRSKTGYGVVQPHISNRIETYSKKEIVKAYSGYSILAAPDDGKSKKNDRKGSRRSWFWSAASRFSTSYTQIIIAAFLINMLGLAAPLFIMNVYDRVIPNLAIPTLWALAFGVVIALILDFFLKLLRSRVIDTTGRKIDMAVSASLFEQLMSMAMASRPAAAGELASKIKEFESISEFFTSSTIVAITDFVFIGVFAAVLYIIVGPLVLVPAIVVPIVIVLTLLVQIPLGRAVRATQNVAGHRHAVLVESINGLEAIKVSAAEHRMQSAWEEAVAATARSTTAARFWSSLSQNITGLIQQSVTIIIMVWGVYLVSEGSITVGALIAASILSGRMLAPLANIAGTIARAQQAFVSMGHINAIMALPTETDVQSGSLAPSVNDGSIEFRNVGFSYPEAAQPALEDVSLRIGHGERIGLIGRVGSGKTTLGRLMIRLFEPSDGLVLVGGLDIRQIHSTDLRHHVGFLPQEPELFSGTLKDNIALGLREVSDTQIEEAARIAGVDTFAAEHPLGLNMPVAERGRSLSGGQKQAVALARLLVRQPKVMFLDEPSSAMDATTEAALVARLREISETGITLIISTHRSSLLSVVDRLIVLDKGRVAADGPRDTVLERLKTAAENRTNLRVVTDGN